MASRLEEIQKEKHELEMTPMIDVTFLLLIFFMCTLKFKTLEGKLAAYLPKDVGVNQADAEPIDNHECHCNVCKSVTGQHTTHVVFFNHGDLLKIFSWWRRRNLPF